MPISIASITPSPDLPAAKAGAAGDKGFAPLMAGLLGPGELAPTCTLLPPDGEALPVTVDAAVTSRFAPVPSPLPDAAPGERAPPALVPSPPVAAVPTLPATPPDDAPADAAYADRGTAEDEERAAPEPDTIAAIAVTAPPAMLLPVAPATTEAPAPAAAATRDAAPPAGETPANRLAPPAARPSLPSNALGEPTLDDAETLANVPSQALPTAASEQPQGRGPAAAAPNAATADATVNLPSPRHPGIEPGPRLSLPTASQSPAVASSPITAAAPAPPSLQRGGTPSQGPGDGGGTGAAPTLPDVAMQARAPDAGQSPDIPLDTRAGPRRAVAAAPVATGETPVILPALQVFAAAMRKTWADARKPAVAAPDPVTVSSAPAGAAAAPPIQPAAPTLDTADRRWPHAMAEQIERLRDAADENSTRIRLLPDALGPVDVAVRRDGDRVHVHFAAAQAETRQLLADAQPRLADAADARGLKLGRTDISGGDPHGGGDRQQRPPAHLPQPSRPTPARAAAADPTDTRIA